MEAPIIFKQGAQVTLEIRQARLQDYPAIAAFIVEAYGALAPYKGQDRWHWQFVDNPFGLRPDNRVPVWIALDGTRVVGQIAVQPTEIKVVDQVKPAGWIVDVMVLPSCRGGGIGQRLYAAIAEEVAILITLTMAPATRRIAEHLNAITLPAVYQFSRWRRLNGQLVRRYLAMRTEHRPRWHGLVELGGHAGFGDLFSVLVNPLLSARDSRSQAAKRGQIQLVEVAEFGADTDNLWRSIQDKYAIVVPRDAAFLNWRFRDCPQMSYRRFVARNDGRTVGYVVLRRAETVELPQGIIVDMVAEQQAIGILSEMLELSIDWFGDTVSSIEFATSIPEVAAMVRSHGFFRTRTHHPTMVCADPVLRRLFSDHRNTWLLSKADHDWDQIHLA